MTLKNHPFAVNAFFESSLVLTFAVPVNELQQFLPTCLTPDTFQEKYGFIAVAMVQTKDLRPKGFPTWLGNDFFLIGYRIFVRYKTQSGKNLRGLYIIKSETDKKKMEFFGNIFTHYNYTTTDVAHTSVDGSSVISSVRSDFDVKVSTDGDLPLPSDSPFTDWKEARRFAGPLPFTFTYNAAEKSVLIIEGVRQNWEPRPVKVDRYHFAFLNNLSISSAILANAFEIKNIPYMWKKGRQEKWR